jgi:hypothetical protein
MRAWCHAGLVELKKSADLRASTTSSNSFQKTVSAASVNPVKHVNVSLTAVQLFIRQKVLLETHAKIKEITNSENILQPHVRFEDFVAVTVVHASVFLDVLPYDLADSNQSFNIYLPKYVHDFTASSINVIRAALNSYTI